MYALPPPVNQGATHGRRVPAPEPYSIEKDPKSYEKKIIDVEEFAENYFKRLGPKVSENLKVVSKNQFKVFSNEN